MSPVAFILLRDVESWLNRDGHARGQDGIPVNVHSVVSIHADVVAEVMGEEPAHQLAREEREDEKKRKGGRERGENKKWSSSGIYIVGIAHQGKGRFLVVLKYCSPEQA